MKASLEAIGGYDVETGGKPFDPLNLCKYIPAETLRKYETVHCRVAMLACVGYAYPRESCVSWLQQRLLSWLQQSLDIFSDISTLFIITYLVRGTGTQYDSYGSSSTGTHGGTHGTCNMYWYDTAV